MAAQFIAHRNVHDFCLLSSSVIGRRRRILTPHASLADPKEPPEVPASCRLIVAKTETPCRRNA